MLFLFPVKSMAQGMEGGESLFGAYLGLGSALQKSGMEVDGKDLSWGNVGAEFGLSYLYFPSAYVGIGAALQLGAFQGSQSTEDVPGRWRWHTFKTDFEMVNQELMGIGRINLNPSSSVRLYIPFGAGVVLSKASMRYTWDDYWKEEEEDYNFSFGWYAGIGVEFEQSERFSWGLEARYNSFKYDYSELASFVGGHVSGKDTQRDYVSLVATFHFK